MKTAAREISRRFSFSIAFIYASFPEWYRGGRVEQAGTIVHVPSYPSSLTYIRMHMKKILATLAILPMFAFTLIASAQTTTNPTTTPTVPPTPTPELPNTGSGGDAATNIALMLASGAVVIGGSIYLTRKLREQA